MRKRDRGIFGPASTITGALVHRQRNVITRALTAHISYVITQVNLYIDVIQSMNINVTVICPDPRHPRTIAEEQ
jgi:hypothetical protein